MPSATPKAAPLDPTLDVAVPTPFPETTKPYRVPTAGLYLSQVAERQLGSALRWIDIYRLNPGLQPEQPLREGMDIRIPMK